MPEYSAEDLTQLDDAAKLELVYQALDRMGLPSLGHVMVKMGRLEAALEYIDGHGCDDDSRIAADALAGRWPYTDDTVGPDQ